MSFPLCLSLSSGIGLNRPAFHFVVSRLLGIDERDRTGGTCIGASRISCAQIALGNNTAIDIVVHRTERTGDGANLAADAQIFVNHFGSGREIDLNGIDRAGMQTPGLFALGAGIRDEASVRMKIENTDPRLRRIEGPFLFVGTRHFALATAGAFIGVEQKRFLHGNFSLRWPVIEATFF